MWPQFNRYDGLKLAMVASYFSEDSGFQKFDKNNIYTRRSEILEAEPKRIYEFLLSGAEELTMNSVSPPTIGTQAIELSPVPCDEAQQR